MGKCTKYLMLWKWSVAKYPASTRGAFTSLLSLFDFSTEEDWRVSTCRVAVEVTLSTEYLIYNLEMHKETYMWFACLFIYNPI